MFGGRLLEDGFPVAVGSSAKRTWLAFVSVLAHLCASAKLRLQFDIASPSSSS